jgi:Family of unknown function (DUF6221)
MGETEAVAWLREQVQARLAAAQAMLSEDWGDLPWAVTECVNGMRGDCPCIVYQGSYKPFRQPQVPPVRYIADAETPQIAQWIIANDPRRVIADCEADLGIIALYDRWAGDYLGGNPELGAAACAISDAARHAASGYRYHPGYVEHWGDSGQ